MGVNLSVTIDCTPERLIRLLGPGVIASVAAVGPDTGLDLNDFSNEEVDAFAEAFAADERLSLLQTPLLAVWRTADFVRASIAEAAAETVEAVDWTGVPDGRRPAEAQAGGSGSDAEHAWLAERPGPYTVEVAPKVNNVHMEALSQVAYRELAGQSLVGRVLTGQVSWPWKGAATADEPVSLDALAQAVAAFLAERVGTTVDDPGLAVHYGEPG